MRRVDEAIRQVIGDAVAGELKDPRVGFTTVTDVRTSPDLRHARVYVSVLALPGGSGGPGGEAGGASTAEEREATLAGLRSAHGFLQARLASELHLKRTPTLEFAYDDTTDRAMRVERLIAASAHDHDEADRELSSASEAAHEAEHAR
jgi:ribosome-binding factor A